MTAHRAWVLDRPERAPVADRPRRCTRCGGPVLLTVDGKVTTDRGREHRCAR